MGYGVEYSLCRECRGQFAHTNQHYYIRSCVMAKKKNPVEVYQLVCKDCGAYNYVTRLKKAHKGLELKKYCPATRNVQIHKAKKA